MYISEISDLKIYYNTCINYLHLKIPFISITFIWTFKNMWAIHVSPRNVRIPKKNTPKRHFYFSLFFQQLINLTWRNLFTSHPTSLLQKCVSQWFHVLVSITAPRRGNTALGGERGVPSLPLLKGQRMGASTVIRHFTFTPAQPITDVVHGIHGVAMLGV